MLLNKLINKKYSKTLPITAMGIILLLQFQNCGQSFQGEENFSSLSGASAIDQIHSDYMHGTEVEREQEKAIELSKSLMDRLTLHSFFVDIFGPNAANLTTMKRIKNEKAIFGGPCSIYDNFKSTRAGNKVDADAIACANSDTANNLAAPIQPSANVLQQALVNNICAESVANATTYKYIASQLKENQNVAVAANTPDNVAKLFSLFYRNKPLPELRLIESLQMLVGFPATDNGWKAAILTTCVSNHWQSL
ncbi:hypothetical protein [Pseudobdellovibrio exovorus]|uniref:Uncharacterized protein n=1 Tax=Pseudobdellovibrio exovorus JSS TaxID=1184267 RepID=M4VAL9_9BACT|nr:hypothetical protein [Pseudobdellovibrio exovorus]AGH95495.1 hypothetical protein A11Q_1279 [Pseudobdellovibrio exovorus JSS]